MAKRMGFEKGLLEKCTRKECNRKKNVPWDYLGIGTSRDVRVMSHMSEYLSGDSLGIS
jgi:hypothetical protein